MEAVLSRLRGLSADELREEFARANLTCGAITATTRAIYERKLARALAEPESATAGLDSSSTAGDFSSPVSVRPPRPPAMPMSTSSSSCPPAEEEMDFGYGMGLNPPEEEKMSVETRATATPSKPAQVSSTFYGVCPLLDDVLARNEGPHVYLDKKEALQAVKILKGARFKAFDNREDAERFAQGTTEYYASPCKSTSCVSPVRPGPLLCKDNMEVDTISRERANSFKSPRTQDLTAKLRRAVEKGDEVAFSELVWSNPRYLIGSGDNPTIVQEGCRYNVMHVAAKENQAGIAQLLLDTLENPDFMRLMYPDDQEVMLQKRIRYIVDLYLNTPDKAGFETPLHFACKFGCPEVVNVVCLHPDTDKNCKNKYDQKPCEVICDRRNKTQEVKQKISDYLEDRCYIPLLRATDNTFQPIVGAPWSPEPSENLSYSLRSLPARSPMEPVMAVKAFAGPLSPSNADEFRRAWKTPPRDRAEHFHHIMKSDPDRGAERVGRDLAHEMGYPWAEYWDFLDCFVDLSSTDGIRKLEEFLNKKDFSQRAHEEAGENETSNRFRTPSPGKSKKFCNSISVGESKKFCNSISVGAFLDEGDDISLEEIKNRQNAALTSSITSCASSKDGLQGALGGREFHILPIALHHRGAHLIETAAEQDPLCCCEDGLLSPGATCKDGLCSSSRDRTHNGDKVSPRTSPSSCLLSPISNLMVEFERMSLQELPDSSGGSRQRESRDSNASEAGSGAGSEAAEGSCWSTSPFSSGAETEERRDSGSSEEFFSAEESLEALGRTRGSVSGGHTFCARSKSWDHGGRDLSSSSSSGSYKSLENSHEFLPRSPPRVGRGLFIEGDSPTKLDREVLLAVGTIYIDPHMYPSINKWKSTMKTYSSLDMQSWPSPAVVKARLRTQHYTPGSPISSLASPVGRFSPAPRHAASPDFSPGRYSPAHASYIQRIRLKQFREPPL